MLAIIVCESCSTRYRVRVDDISEEGREVECTNCGHRWFQSPIFESDDAIDSNDPMVASEEELLQDQKIEDQEAENQKIEDQEAARRDDRVKQRAALRTAKNAGASSSYINGLRIKKSPNKADVNDSHKQVEQGKLTRKFSLLLKMLLGINLLILVVLLLGAVREEIPTLLEPVYRLFGIYDTYLLEFDNVVVSSAESGVVTVSADVINNSARDKYMPHIRFSLLDVRGRTIGVDFLKNTKKEIIKKNSRYSFAEEIKKLPKRAAVLVIDIGNKVEFMLI